MADGTKAVAPVVDALRAALADDRAVVTGDAMARWCTDWTGQFRWAPLCVIRPADTAGVSAALRVLHGAGVPVVPVSGNTGLTGGTVAEGAAMLSLDRMRTIRRIAPDARMATVEAGVILSDLHAAVAAEGLRFPMTFGAKGSAMIGGMLATNAGGSNVLRYGNTRDLVLGLEAVLADGTVIDLMGGLHKDNSGYDLRHLLIGSEGTLGIITGAVLKLVPEPAAQATAMIAAASLPDALRMLNDIQAVTGGAVEAFEYMDAPYCAAYRAHAPGAVLPFDTNHPVTILCEIASTDPAAAQVDATGQRRIDRMLEEALTRALEAGQAVDAVLAASHAQRAAFWAMREAAAEVTVSRKPVLICDIAVAVDKVDAFVTAMADVLPRVDPGAQPTTVAHLGDGNLHYSVWPGDPASKDAIADAVEEAVVRLGGTFSAEHGIGTVKRAAMGRRKDPGALAAMRAIKAGLDPKGILNPGKILP